MRKSDIKALYSLTLKDSVVNTVCWQLNEIKIDNSPLEY